MSVNTLGSFQLIESLDSSVGNCFLIEGEKPPLLFIAFK